MVISFLNFKPAKYCKQTTGIWLFSVGGINALKASRHKDGQRFSL